jgi:hypothetical protein
MTNQKIPFAVDKAIWDTLVGLFIWIAAIALLIWLIVSAVRFFWSNPLF